MAQTLLLAWAMVKLSSFQQIPLRAGQPPSVMRTMESWIQLPADQMIKVWKLDGSQILSLDHSNRMYAVAFSSSSNGELIASGGGDETVKIWNATSGDIIYALNAQKGLVSSISISPNGHVLASGGWGVLNDRDAGTQFWDLATGEKMAERESERVSSVAFSPNGKYVLTGTRFGGPGDGGPQGNITLWNVEGLYQHPPHQSLRQPLQQLKHLALLLQNRQPCPLPRKPQTHQQHKAVTFACTTFLRARRSTIGVDTIGVEQPAPRPKAANTVREKRQWPTCQFEQAKRRETSYQHKMPTKSKLHNYIMISIIYQ